MCDRRDFIKTSLWAMGSIGVTGTPLQGEAQTTDGKKYMCPPCGCAMDGAEFDQPGKCPACGMELVEKSAEGQIQRIKVAILIFNGVQIIDFAAPYEVFGQAGYDVFSVGETKSSVTTAMGLAVTPRFDFANCPQPDVLLTPGGDIDGALSQESTIGWVRARSKQAHETLSVCNGAFFLAQAGLLNGLSATTYHRVIENLRAKYPQVVVVSNRRWVDNGAIITTAGLSSGIDGALHIVQRLSGLGAAQMVALNMEYDWKRDGVYARASFADLHLRKIFGERLRLDLPAGYRQIVESTQGDASAWETIWGISSNDNAIESAVSSLTATIAAAIASKSNWKMAAAAKRGTNGWNFTDEQQQRWQARLNIDGESPRKMRATLTVRTT